LYYLRDLRGKAAKIRERRGGEDLEAVYSQSATSVAEISEPVAEPVAQAETEVEVAAPAEVTEDAPTKNEA
jgi:hypothetical protein